MPDAQGRSSEQIRRSIEATRGELTYDVKELQGKVTELTDWRARLRENRQPVIVGAAAAGFILGGGLAGFFGLFRRR